MVRRAPSALLIVQRLRRFDRVARDLLVQSVRRRVDECPDAADDPGTALTSAQAASGKEIDTDASLCAGQIAILANGNSCVTYRPLSGDYS